MAEWYFWGASAHSGCIFDAPVVTLISSRGPSVPCFTLFAACSCVQGATVLSGPASRHWVGAGQGWGLYEQGARLAAFSQADNFVLGQKRWHHDGQRWRCGHKGQETLSPTMAPWRGVRGTQTWQNNTPIRYFSHSPLSTHRNTHLWHVCSCWFL